MIPEVVELLARASGVERATNFYRSASDPDSASFIRPTGYRFMASLFEGVLSFSAPTSSRIYHAKYNPNSQVDSELKFRTVIAGWTADATFGAFMPVELAIALHYPPDSWPLLIANKIAVNAAMHLSLDGAKSLLDKIKGSPIQIRV